MPYQQAMGHWTAAIAARAVPLSHTWLLTPLLLLQSFTKVEGWRQAVLAAGAGAAAPLLALVANKADLPGPARAVTPKEHNSYVEQHDMFRWVGQGWQGCWAPRLWAPGPGSGVWRSRGMRRSPPVPAGLGVQPPRVVSHMLAQTDAAWSSCAYRSNAAA
jgi:hypothetical protein